MYLTPLNFVYALWFLRVIKPEWIAAYFVPGLGILKALPTLILYGLVAYGVLASRKKLSVDKPYLLFYCVILASTLLSQNTGRSLIFHRNVLDALLTYVVVVSFIENSRQLDKLIGIYLVSFVFYGIAGTIYSGRVPFHVALSDEDALGPFMAIGLPISFYFSLRSGKVRYRALIVSGVCMLGLIASFARGAFLSACAAGAFIWVKFKRKAAITIVLLLGVVLFAVIAGSLFEGGKYWAEMMTIGESLQNEKQEGRHFLNRKGLQIFMKYPILGAGPGCYGWALPKITSDEEADGRGVYVEHFYYRVPHNIYIQVLSELGIVGVLSFLVVLVSFWKRNRFIEKSFAGSLREEPAGSNGEDAELTKLHAYSLGLQGALFVYLVNGAFYDILYYHWLPDILILNTLCYRLCVEKRLATGSNEPA